MYKNKHKGSSQFSHTSSINECNTDHYLINISSHGLLLNNQIDLLNDYKYHKKSKSENLEIYKNGTFQRIKITKSNKEAEKINYSFESDNSIDIACLIERDTNIIKFKEDQSTINLLLSIDNDFVKSYILNNQDKSLLDNLLNLIKSKQGSKLLQNIIENSDISLVDYLYSILKNHIYNLFVHYYANYFLQTLYYRLSHTSRCEVLEKINQNTDMIYENNNGLCSLIFVIENTCNPKEVSILMNMIKSNFKEHKWNKYFLRVLESVICCFPLESILFIREFALNNFYKLINIREGYFVLRSVVKISKCHEIQNLIFSYISKNFVKFVNGPNGSLICQCLLHNFPLEQYIHTKSYSKHLQKESSKETNIIKYDMNNPVIIKLIKLLFVNIQIWQKKSFRALLECAIKVSITPFEIRLIKSIKKYDRPLEKIVSFDTHYELLKEIISNLSNEGFYFIINYLFEYLQEAFYQVEHLINQRKKKLQEIKTKKFTSQKSVYSININNSFNNIYPAFYQHSPYFPNIGYNYHQPICFYSNNSSAATSSTSTAHLYSNYNQSNLQNQPGNNSYFLSSNQLPSKHKLEKVTAKETTKSLQIKK